MIEREQIKNEHGFQQFRSIKIGHRKIKLAGLLAVVIFVATAAAAGVVGNFAYAILPSLWHWLTTLEVNKVWLWGVVFLQLIALLCISYGWWQTNGRAKEESDLWEKLIESDESLLRLIPNMISLISEKDLEVAAQKIAGNLLLKTTELFAKDVTRASLFMPDAKGEYLKIWAHYQMPQDSIARTQFSLGESGKGSANKKLGIALEAYRTKQIIVVHIDKKGNKWQVDNNNYINFCEDRIKLPYKSLICIPVSGGRNNSDPLGVMCLDSLDGTVFDDASIYRILQKQGSQLAKVLLIYQKLQTACLQVK